MQTKNTACRLTWLIVCFCRPGGPIALLLVGMFHMSLKVPIAYNCTPLFSNEINAELHNLSVCLVVRLSGNVYKPVCSALRGRSRGKEAPCLLDSLYRRATRQPPPRENIFAFSNPFDTYHSALQHCRCCRLKNKAYGVFNVQITLSAMVPSSTISDTLSAYT